jgi:beta-lactamase class A
VPPSETQPDARPAFADAASRRGVIAGAAASLVATSALAGADPFAAVEAKVGGRLGVAALDLGSGARLGHRDAERFAMCSTFKLMAAAAVLSRVDRGVEHLDRFVAYGAADVLSYAPVTSAHVKEGGLPLAALCAAAVELSDNTAANLILASIGGPAGWTSFVRSLGDVASRLDRKEPALNSADPNDPRDTTTPLAMLSDLRMAVFGKLLSQASRDRLIGWMVDCQTGKTRIRAGVPTKWRVGDKTGSGRRGTANDIAVIWTDTAPILIASYLTGATSATSDEVDAAHAEVGRIVARTFRPGSVHG